MNYDRRVLATKTNYYLSDREIIARLQYFRERATKSESKPEGEDK
jgi:hypothetical protein